MADAQENHSNTEISAEDVFKQTKTDALYNAFKTGLSSGIPVFGGVAAEVFGTFIPSFVTLG